MLFTDDVGKPAVEDSEGLVVGDPGGLVVGDLEGLVVGGPEGLLQRSPTQQLVSQCEMPTPDIPANAVFKGSQTVFFS